MPKEHLTDLSKHLTYLYAFAKEINELDFAMSLAGEFRGMQDAGWDTQITAHEVFHEAIACVQTGEQLTKAQCRIVLMLYCQLAEAGGVYESLKNIMAVVTLKPYSLWPFRDLVRVKKGPKRIIGPNANATFRDLASSAADIGLLRLSGLLESAFSDAIRNGIAHADYVLWDDGLRLPRRNGGGALRISFEELNGLLADGLGFFELVNQLRTLSIQAYDPPKVITGRFSANPPMPHTVKYDPATGAFGLSTSSPGSVKTQEYVRKEEIQSRLGGKVIALYTLEPSTQIQGLLQHILDQGFDPVHVVMTKEQLNALADDVERLGLWDARIEKPEISSTLLASPWGFRELATMEDFDSLLPAPYIDIE